MKKYEKPVVMINEELAEGVYAASGCYVVRCSITQTPEEGRKTYIIQVNADHAPLDHHSTGQVMKYTFNVPVSFVSFKKDGVEVGNCKSANGGYELIIQTDYHNNHNEYGIGLGNLEVSTAETDILTTVTASFDCNYTCSQHDSLGIY